MRTQNEWIEKTKASCTSLYTEMQDLTRQHQQCRDDLQARLQNEFAILRKCAKALGLILAHASDVCSDEELRAAEADRSPGLSLDQKHLKLYQQKLHVQMLQSQNQSQVATAVPRPVFGSSAPCQKSMQLRVFGEIEGNVAGFYSCGTAEAIKGHAKTFLSVKHALGDLSTSCKAGLKEYKSAKASASKAMERVAPSARPVVAATDIGKVGAASQLFDLLHELGQGQKIECLTPPLDSDGKPVAAGEAFHPDSPTVPYLMHLPTTFPLLAVTEGNTFQTSLGFFMPDFLQSPLRKEQGRASQDLDVIAAECVKLMLLPLLPAHYSDTEFKSSADKIASEALVSACAPSMFGVAPNATRCFIEKGYLPSARMTTKGTRKVVLCDLIATRLAMEKFYSGDGAPPSPSGQTAARDMTPTTVLNFVKTATVEVLKRMHAQAPEWKPYAATVGPQDRWQPTCHDIISDPKPW